MRHGHLVSFLQDIAAQPIVHIDELHLSRVILIGKSLSAELDIKLIICLTETGSTLGYLTG